MTADHKRVRIGEALLDDGAITQEQLVRALSDQKTSGRMLGELLVEQNVISGSTLVKTLAKRIGLSGCTLRHGLMDPALLKKIGSRRSSTASW